MDAKKDQKIVVLATGGTIAGVAGDVSKPNKYLSAQLNVSELTQNLVTHGVELVREQVFNIDSKDMQFAHWQNLLGRCDYWLGQNDVAGLIVTHGTDTLEETAFFLQSVLQPTKPVAMTCAMFPANVPQSDGPKNLQDALNWVLHTSDLGVHLVCAGEVLVGIGVQKIYSDRNQAFASRDKHSGAGKTPLVQMGWSIPTVEQVLSTKHWPRVEIVLNHAGADGQFVRTLIKANAMNTQTVSDGTKLSKTDGIIVAGTGSGTLSEDLEKALLDAQKAGIGVARVSRCAFGAADPEKHPNIPALLNLSPVQARVAMILGLLARRSTA